MQYYKEKKQLLFKSWHCEKEELIVKVQATFADAWEQHDSHEKLQLERLQQQKLCKKLHEKVRKSFVLVKSSLLCILIGCCMATSKTRDVSIGDNNK